eukprot:719016-Prorocentrum_minimum.AAC.1
MLRGERQMHNAGAPSKPADKKKRIDKNRLLVCTECVRCDDCVTPAGPSEGADMDVRMLGNGRPFVLEVTNARAGMLSDGVCAQLEGELNASDCGVSPRETGSHPRARPTRRIDTRASSPNRPARQTLTDPRPKP